MKAMEVEGTESCELGILKDRTIVIGGGMEGWRYRGVDGGNGASG